MRLKLELQAGAELGQAQVKLEVIVEVEFKVIAVELLIKVEFNSM